QASRGRALRTREMQSEGVGTNPSPGAGDRRQDSPFVESEKPSGAEHPREPPLESPVMTNPRSPGAPLAESPASQAAGSHGPAPDRAAPNPADPDRAVPDSA